MCVRALRALLKRNKLFSAMHLSLVFAFNYSIHVTVAWNIKNEKEEALNTRARASIRAHERERKSVAISRAVSALRVASRYGLVTYRVSDRNKKTDLSFYSTFLTRVHIALFYLRFRRYRDISEYIVCALRRTGH